MRLSTIVAVSIFAISLSAAGYARQVVPLDRDWRFHIGEVENGQQPQLDDGAWRTLDIPHDWAIEGAGNAERSSLPSLNVVKGEWRFHKGDNPQWKQAKLDDHDWQTVKLPNWWNDHSGYNDQNCYGWYSRKIEIPKRLQGKTFIMLLGLIDDADEAFLNGHKIGATGHMPPNYETAWDTPRFYKIDPKWLDPHGENVLAVRVYNGQAKGGWYDVGPAAASAEGPFDPFSPSGNGGGYLNGGIGWYRKGFTLPPEDKGQKVEIQFDGAYMDSQVWINGHLLGRHPYGYTGFQYDLTPHLKDSGSNVLAVRLEVKQPCSRWYSGAGIYRHVRLMLTDPVHVPTWGVYVTTPRIAADSADVKVRTQVTAGALTAMRVESRVLDPQGAEAGRAETQADAAADGKPVEQTIRVASPKLWSLDTPQLYKLVTKVYVGDKCADTCETPFGIRTIEFTRDRGFLLNGRHVPLYGVCNHHDLGCLGAAVNRRAIERQLEIMKGLGCNSIRTSHNPPAPELLDLCDRMGFVVMDEAFDEWKAGKTPHGYGRFFDEWSERDIVSMLHRDRNHPCVIMWSIGNEIPEQGAKNGHAMAQRLADFCRREDPTRPTTSACNNSGNADRTGYAKALDVFGINYSLGAYRQFKDRYDLVGSETSSALSTRGEYGLQIGKDGKVIVRHEFNNQVTSYDVVAPGWGYIAERDLMAMAASPWVAGEYVWTGFDYLGEPTPYAWPSRSSYFGIVDLAGFPKDRYYLYRSVWRPEPLVHLLPHWNWPGFEGKEIPVWAFTNCDTVELILNGKSLGEKPLVRSKSLHIEWSVPYAPGVLKAIGKRDGKVVVIDEVQTIGEPARLVLKPDRSRIAADGDDLSFVTVEVVDKDGRVCPLADQLVQFKLTGPGTIAGVDNGDPINHEPFKADRHKVFHGLGLVVIRGKPTAGTITLHAEAKGLTSAETAIEAK